MKQVLFSFFIIALITGCGPNENAKEVKNVQADMKDTAVKAEASSMAGCYRMVIGKDTAYMQLEEKGDSLHGPLSYKRFEKDSNKGNVYLIKRNGRAEGRYTFQSEGMISVREIIFKIAGNSLDESFGDIEMRGDTAMYKYPHALRFEEKHPFVKVDCK